MTLPWVVIFKQAGIGFAPPAEVNVWLLITMGAALGIPGAAQVLPKLLSIWFSGGQGGIGGSPSAEAPERSPSGRSSPIEPSARES